MKKFGLIGLFLLAFAGTAHAQGPQCRTSPVGASTANCASEAFVTKTGATAAQISGTPSNHQIAGWTSSTQIEGLGPCGVGQPLVGNGASADASCQSGVWVLLNTLTASNSTTLSDTSSITSSYKEYLLVFENILPATNNVTAELQVHANSAFQSSSYLATTASIGGSTNIANTTTFIQLSQAALLENTLTGLNGEITFYNPSQATSPKWVTGTSAHNNGTFLAVSLIGGGWGGGNNAVDGFQVLMSSGNITSGTIKIYGRQ